MYSITDALIFPAPKPGYTASSLKGKLIFVPKFKDYYFEKKQKDKFRDFEGNSS